MRGRFTRHVDRDGWVGIFGDLEVELFDPAAGQGVRRRARLVNHAAPETWEGKSWRTK